MAAIIGIVQEQAQRMFFLFFRCTETVTFGFLTLPPPSQRGRVPHHLILVRGHRHRCEEAGRLLLHVLCAQHHREYSPAVPIIVLGDIKAKLTGKMAASAVLTRIHLILSVVSPIYLALGVRERAESAHAPCEPFCLLFSLRPPDSGAGQYLYLRVAKCGRLWADS